MALLMIFGFISILAVVILGIGSFFIVLEYELSEKKKKKDMENWKK